MGERACREIVFVLHDGEVIAELRFDTFLGDDLTFPELAASSPIAAKPHAPSFQSAEAAYCVVGNGLTLQAVVFFRFQVNGEGRLEQRVDLPYAQMAQQAGKETTPAGGEVRCARKGQCPVPWHAAKLWDPQNPALMDELALRVRQNTLDLSRKVHGEPDDFFAPTDFMDEPLLAPQSVFKDFSSDEETQALDALFGPAEPIAVDTDEPRVSLAEVIRQQSDKLKLARSTFEEELVARDAVYQTQIRSAREEILELKLALRKEQARSRKLKEALSGSA